MKRLVIDYKKLYRATRRKQTAIAESIGISQPCLSKFLNQKSGSPTFEMLNDICQAIDRNTLEFLQYTESTPER